MSAILVGDIGGTNCRLALAEVTGDNVTLQHITRFQNANVAGLHEHIKTFLNDRERPDKAVLAVAGPTDGTRVKFTNLAWSIDANELCAGFGFQSVRLINDFSAVGYGLASLQAGDVKTLQAGFHKPNSTHVAAGAGTGLGVVISTWDGKQYQPHASEGGHISFAPIDDEQMALLRFLLDKQGDAWGGRVSVERLISGPGIETLYDFCLATAEAVKTDAGKIETRTASEITQAALAGNDANAVHALQLFARIYAQTAGDLALIAQAHGGVYLAGGIPPKILPFLEEAAFLESFCRKGRYRDWLRNVPVNVVLDPDIGLKGAALAA